MTEDVFSRAVAVPDQEFDAAKNIDGEISWSFSGSRPTETVVVSRRFALIFVLWNFVSNIEFRVELLASRFFENFVINERYCFGVRTRLENSGYALSRDFYLSRFVVVVL